MKRGSFSSTVCIFALQVIFLLPFVGWTMPLPPVANTGGPYIIEQGHGVTLDGSMSTDANFPDDYFKVASWDINNDGVYDFTSIGTDINHPASLILSISAADLTSFGINQVGRTYILQLQVTDSTDLYDSDYTTLLIKPGTSPVAEPTTILLLGLGLMGLAKVRRKFKK